MRCVQPDALPRGLESTPEPAWIAALDSLGLSLLVFDRHAREVHRSAALDTRLRRDATATRQQIFRTAEQMARALFDAPRIVQDATVRGSAQRQSDENELWPAAASCYRIRAVRVDEPSVYRTASSRPLVLVIVEPGAAPLPSPERLREQFALTRREAEVALRLACRMHNNEIARSLCISEHTARRHTEHVLDKLHVRRRVDVLRVLQGVHAALTALSLTGFVHAPSIATALVGIGFRV